MQSGFLLRHLAPCVNCKCTAGDLSGAAELDREGVLSTAAKVAVEEFEHPSSHRDAAASLPRARASARSADKCDRFRQGLQCAYGASTSRLGTGFCIESLQVHGLWHASA